MQNDETPKPECSAASTAASFEPSRMPSSFHNCIRFHLMLLKQIEPAQHGGVLKEPHIVQHAPPATPSAHHPHLAVERRGPEPTPSIPRGGTGRLDPSHSVTR